MSILVWEKSFELGIQQFDEHHKHLVALLNKTYDNFTGGANRETLGAVLDELIDYATYHFSAEEQWMDSRGYDGLAQHREIHNKFCQRIVEIQKDFYAGKTYLSLEVLTFLTNWLIDHILKTDVDYVRFAAGHPET